MFSLRLITFVLVYLLFSQHVWSAHEERGKEDLPRSVKDRIMGFAESAPSVRKEMQTGIPSAKEVKEHARASGRKLKIRKVISQDSTAKGSESYIGEASKVSGASVDSTAGSKDVASRNKVTPGSKGHSRLVRVKTGRFVPFSADYHVPRPHPPKNN